MITDPLKTHEKCLPELSNVRKPFAGRESTSNWHVSGTEPAAQETASLAAISDLAIQLAVAADDVDPLELLAESLKRVTGAIAVGITTYDPEARMLTGRYVAADSPVQQKIGQVLGRSLVGLQATVSDEILKEMQARVIRIEKDLSVTTFGAVPPPGADALQKALGIGHYAGLALFYGEELMGTALLIMPRERQALPAGTLRALAHLAAASVQRRQAEEALRESEELYRMLVETSPDGIMLMDLESNILMANRELVRLTGYESAGQLFGKKGLDFVIPEEQPVAAEKLSEFLECGTLRDRDYQLVRPDGSIFPAEISLSLVKDAHNQPRALIGVVRDVSARKQLEAAAQEQMEALKQAQARLIDAAKMAAVGELAAGVAHELNNPLTVILGFSELLLEQEVGDARDRARLQAIARQAVRIRDTVNNLVSFSQQTFFQREKASVNQVLSETLALIRLRMKVAGITIKEQYAAGLPPLLLDSGRMKQVFLNLLTNALQAMPDGGVVTIRSEQVGDRVAVRIADTGQGISAEVRPRIFEPFFTTKPVGGGSGLGLPVSLGIVEKHHGSIEAESTAGQGSTFTVWLPIKDPDQPPDEAASVESSSP